MKVLEFETSKGIFKLIDMPETIRVNGWNGNIMIDELNQISQEKYSKGFYLKNITEEQAIEIVDKHRFGYKNYTWRNPKLGGQQVAMVISDYCRNAIDSLLSLIDSKGIYLYEKPYLPEELINNQEAFMADLKAEQKTFYNPYIFKL